jgi:hypothetical protein
MDTRTAPRTYTPGDEPLDRRVVSRGPDLELWQGPTCHACWTRDEVVGYPSFWPSVNRWLETGMREDLRQLLDELWMTRLPPDPVRVNLPPPRVRGFDEMFRRIGDGLDSEVDAKVDRAVQNTERCAEHCDERGAFGGVVSLRCMRRAGHCGRHSYRETEARRLDEKETKKPARIDPTPTIAPGTIRKDPTYPVRKCGHCGTDTTSTIRSCCSAGMAEDLDHRSDEKGDRR